MRQPNYYLILQKINSKSWSSFLFWYGLFFGLSILVRLPHFLSRVFWFDGDEAIVGIMAQDLLAGKNFALYFYGQGYGLTIFESLSVAIWIKILGTGIWALRLGGLTLYAFGIYFLFKGLKARGRSELFSFLFALAIICFPSWMLWGAMVRGGYVTALAASFFLFYLISRKIYSWKNILMISILLTIVFDSHNLLLFTLAPLLLRDWILNKGSWLRLLVGFGIALAFYFLLHSTVVDNGHMYTPWVDYTVAEFPERLSWYFNGFLHSYGGFYYLGYLFTIPIWWKYLMMISLVIISILTLRLFVVSYSKDKLFLFAWIIGLLSIIGVCAIAVGYSARYLISFFTGFIFLFAFYDGIFVSNKYVKNMSVLVLLIFMIGIGIGSKQPRDWYESNAHCMKAIDALHKQVVKNKIKAVFVTDELKQWQWNYLYGKDIPANPFGYQERINSYLNAADSIYRNEPGKTAIIGNWGVFLNMDSIPQFNETRIPVETKYFIQPVMTSRYHDMGYKARGLTYSMDK